MPGGKKFTISQADENVIKTAGRLDFYWQKFLQQLKNAKEMETVLEEEFDDLQKNAKINILKQRIDKIS